MSAAIQPVMPDSRLTDRDFANFAQSWITPELCEQARLRRVDQSEGAAILGRGNGNFAGIAFPYIWPDLPGVRESRIRRDSPEIEYKNGRPREKQKYMAAPGGRNHLYFVPGTTQAELEDISLPLVFTEGEKKAIALFRLSNHEAVSPRFRPVGLSGVWNWRGVTGKAGGPNGERRDTKGPIPDLARVSFGGRTVYILFDANTQTDSSVAAARNQLAAELTTRGARVLLIDLPAVAGVNGIDDYLGAGGPAAALELFEKAREFDPKEQLSKLPRTDYGNEKAFEILFGDQFLYDWTGRRWLRWNGVYWESDCVNSIDRYMLKVANERLDATALLTDATEGESGRKQAVAAALKLQNIRGRQSAIDSATSNERFAKRAEDFDQDDYLFACSNGVIELKTGWFRPGRREDMLTRATTVEYDWSARCERWLRFLSDVFGDDEGMLEFIQRAAGYSMLGLTSEEVFFILYGKGRNGKGTFLRVLLQLLGDYAVNTDFSTLIADKGNKGPRNDLASMAGRRLVTAQESREGAQFDESLIKALTGGDLITARFLHKEFFTFRPTWKIWIATNHRPEIRGSDDGIWSRPKLIPFDVSFEGREDRGLKAALLDPRELSGVLNWALEGCQNYLKDGLKYPSQVTEATAQYKADSDFLGRFISEYCITGAGSVTGRALYQEFSKWASETGEQGISETAFGLRMKERGFQKQRTNRGMAYSGIGLRTFGHSSENYED